MSNRDTVRQFYELASKGESPLELMREDIEWTLLGPKEHIPYVGTYVGKEGYMQWLQIFLANVEILEFPVHEIIEDGDMIVALGFEKIRVRSTGRECSYNWAHYWNLKDGKLAKYTEFIDTAAVMLAYGEGE